MGTFEEAEIAAGIKPGHQMSRFLLWVGNEVLERRETLPIRISHVPELTKTFLAQELEQSLSGGI
jgi:hypothetical protein